MKYAIVLTSLYGLYAGLSHFAPSALMSISAPVFCILAFVAFILIDKRVK